MKSEKRPNKHAGRNWLIVGGLLIVAALLLTLYNVWDNNRAGKASQEVLGQLEEQIEDQTDTDIEQLEELANSGALPADREMPTIEIDGYQYIGYLYVPSLELELPVMDSWDYDRLRIAPCRYYGSVYTNTLVIAGHNYQKHFSPLRYLGIGTEIDFTDADGILYRYEISDVEVLSPSSVLDMIQPSDDWDMTLFTCTIGGQTRHTIRCKRID